MQFLMLLAKIVNSDKSDIVNFSRNVAIHLIFHFNEQPTLAHSGAPLATQKIAETSE